MNRNNRFLVAVLSALVGLLVTVLAVTLSSRSSRTEVVMPFAFLVSWFLARLGWATRVPYGAALVITSMTTAACAAACGTALRDAVMTEGDPFPGVAFLLLTATLVLEAARLIVRPESTGQRSET